MANHTFLDNLTPFISRRRREDATPRCPSKPSALPAVLLFPALNERMQHPTTVPFLPRNLQTHYNTFFLLFPALDERMQHSQRCHSSPTVCRPKHAEGTMMAGHRAQIKP
jgi:hypothetical protein